MYDNAVSSRSSVDNKGGKTEARLQRNEMVLVRQTCRKVDILINTKRNVDILINTKRNASLKESTSMPTCRAFTRCNFLRIWKEKSIARTILQQCGDNFYLDDDYAWPLIPFAYRQENSF